MKSYRTCSSDETKRLAADLAKNLLKEKTTGHAKVIGLSGLLGAGKTTFVQGFFRGLGLRKKAASPTFVLARRTALKKGKFRNVFHVDAYRLRGDDELRGLGLERVFKDPRNVVLVEWADKAKKMMPEDSMMIFFGYGAKENERTIKISGFR